MTDRLFDTFSEHARKKPGLRNKNKKKALRMLSLWEKTKLEILDCYLVASLEDDKQNLLYSYDRDFDRFSIDRREP